MNMNTYFSSLMLVAITAITSLASCNCVLLPLSVVDDQVVDRNGKAFQFRCVAWVGHMESNLPEGLQHQPLFHIIDTIVSSGTFNCVRLSYAVEIFDKKTMTARESLMASLDGSLAPHIMSFEQHNPELIDLPLLTVFQTVVGAISSRGLLVLMNNHVSKAGWCCSNADGNGWFNTGHFDVPKWLSSLSSMVSLLSQYPNAVAFDIRNELRTNAINRTSQIDDWMKYTPQGIIALNNANPDVLIFVGGLKFSSDFEFLDEGRNTQEWININARLRNKIVFEGHIYPWTFILSITEDCRELMPSFEKRVGWSKRNNQPLVIGEFGVDTDRFSNDKRSIKWFGCLKRYIVNEKLGYAVWALGSSYFFVDGQMNREETFGLLDTQWAAFKKNDTFARELKGLEWLENSGLLEIA